MPIQGMRLPVMWPARGPGTEMRMILQLTVSNDRNYIMNRSVFTIKTVPHTRRCCKLIDLSEIFYTVAASTFTNNNNCSVAIDGMSGFLCNGCLLLKTRSCTKSINLHNILNNERN